MRVSLRGKVRLLSAGFLAIFYCSVTFADTWQTGQFLKSLEGRDLDLPFWRDGLKSVNGIDFNNRYSAYYKNFTNRLGLEESASDGGDRLLSFDEMSRINLGTLAHESLHAFFANHLSQRKEYRDLHQEFRLRARTLYWDLPPQKAYQALEEAYAVFIGNTITQVRWADWTIQHYEKQASVDCDQANTFLQRMWSQNWLENIYGYYYRDSIGEYWEDQFQKVWAWLNDDPSLQPPQENLIFVETSIEDYDRQWISSNLFENRLNQNFQKSVVSDGFCENFSY